MLILVTVSAELCRIVQPALTGVVVGLRLVASWRKPDSNRDPEMT